MKGMIGQLEDRLMKLPGLREGGANEAEEEMKRQIQDVMEENARLKQELKKVKQVEFKMGFNLFIPVSAEKNRLF